MTDVGPQLPFSDQLHAEKYRGEGETFKESMNRVANALCDDESHFRALREILLDMRFMPGGRVQAAMGSTKNVTPYNCFVSGTIEDSFVEGGGSIMQRATDAAQTMRLGGGIGYDFSTLRPRGATIKKLQSRSSGAVSFMDIFNAVGNCVASSGHRRGAQMGVLRVDHPDIEEFIHAKQNEGRLTGFNVSIAVTDEFMDCLREDKPFPLRFGGQVYKEVQPGPLWDVIMRGAWDWAEPGVLFIDAINRENNLSYCERIAATNPCGEQPLPPHGACLLGSFNLTKYIRHAATPERALMFDFNQFYHDIPIVVRAMDNVVDRAAYPLWEQEQEAKGKRRMGLGVTGLANALEALGHPYSSPEFLHLEKLILTGLRDYAYEASVGLAAEKGSFPRFVASQYTASPYVKRLPEHIQDGIWEYGIRNSHLISIAPTGTISLAADNISSGIEPVFAHEMRRQINMDAGPREETIPDYGVRVFGHRGRVASEVDATEHLEVLRVAAPLVDSAISKTCNVPSSMAWEDFKRLYIVAHELGLKGLTTFQMGGRREGILEAVPGADYGSHDEDGYEAACRIDIESGRRECE